MGERESFLIKPKHQCHLSQLVELVCGAQSWKWNRLLCESMFVLIDRWILILKSRGKKAFLMKPKHQYY